MRFYFYSLLFVLIGCKVSDRSVAGTYVEPGGRSIVLNPDHTCKISVAEGKIAFGDWLLKDGYLSFTMYDENYLYLKDLSFKINRKKIVSPNLEMFPHCVNYIYKRLDKSKD